MLGGKITDQRVLRKIVLEGHRFTPSELLDAGLVDKVVDGDTEVLLRSASEIAEKWSVNATTGVWGWLRVISIVYLLIIIEPYKHMQNGLYSNVTDICSQRNVNTKYAKPRL